MNISDDEAIARAVCPRCEQQMGEACVYVLPRALTYARLPHPPSLQAKAERVGTPTTHVHPERRDIVRELRRGEPLPPRGAVKVRNELRVLEAVADGEWHDIEDLRGAHSEPAIQRCYDAGWIELKPKWWDVRITESGRAQLKEAGWPT